MRAVRSSLLSVYPELDSTSVRLIDQLFRLFLEDSILKDQHALAATFMNTYLLKIHSVLFFCPNFNDQIDLIVLVLAVALHH